MDVNEMRKLQELEFSTHSVDYQDVLVAFTKEVFCTECGEEDVYVVDNREGNVMVTFTCGTCLKTWTDPLSVALGRVIEILEITAIELKNGSAPRHVGDITIIRDLTDAPKSTCVCYLRHAIKELLGNDVRASDICPPIHRSISRPYNQYFFRIAPLTQEE